MTANYFEDALKNPLDFEVEVVSVPTEDYEGNYFERKDALLYRKGGPSHPKDYEVVCASYSFDQLLEAFELHNPDAVTYKD